MSYTAYTDGGSSPNPGAGGWGVYWVVGDDIQNGEEFYGSEQHTTNNKMELTAVI
jgi:ribonuclease HI